MRIPSPTLLCDPRPGIPEGFAEVVDESSPETDESSLETDESSLETLVLGIHVCGTSLVRETIGS